MIKIVKAEEKHIPAIKELWWEFINFHADIEPLFTPKEDAAEGFEKDFLRLQMTKDTSLVLVALDGDKAVGYAVSEIQEIPGSKMEKCGFVNHLHVQQSYRRQGVGEKLYRETVKWFHARGIKIVEIQLTAQNKVACDFWRKMGYQDLQHTWYREI